MDQAQSETEKIRQLVGMGFEEHMSRAALTRTYWNVSAALERLLNGDTSVDEADNDRITLLEMSQYNLTDGSSSACTCVAWTFVAVGLEFMRMGRDFENSVDLTDILMEGVNSYQELAMSGSIHLSVEEYLEKKAESHRDVRLIHGPKQCVLRSTESFREYVDEIYSTVTDRSRPIGIVITKPPESIGLILKRAADGTQCFYLFDSHSRPEMGLIGAHLLSTNDLDAVIRHLNSLFPSVDSGGDSVMDMMYNCFEGNAFQVR